MDTQTEKLHSYVSLLARIKAIFADTLVMVAFMAFMSLLFSNFENVPDWIRGAAFAFIFFLYDPLLTTLLGGTLGHRMYGIRIRRESNESKNIHFFWAFVRFFSKVFLGWISLLTVTSNSKKIAIHDYIAGSVAIHAPQE